jgi:hypothetical protein
MDVKTVFLNGELEEEIYINQPQDFVVKGQEHKVCKLIKSLYGLKQAPRQWHIKFDEIILGDNFRINEFDKCVYYKKNNSDFIILCLYVDDILLFGTSLKIIQETKNYLSSKFDMKDLGEADIILGMKLKRTNNEIAINLTNSIEKMLKKFEYFDLGPISTPYDHSSHLTKNLGEPVRQLEYSQRIGSLLYVANRTRPDIAYAVGRLSRYTSNPSKDHWKALERVFRYLKGTLDYSLLFSGYPEILEGYSDANWVTDNSSVKSITGYLFMLGGGAVSWGSCKQTIITRSTLKSELTALDTTCTEA